MPNIRVSKPLAAKIRAIQPLVEAIAGKELSFVELVEMIVQQGMDATIAAIMGSVDAETLLKSFQQLGERNPSAVFGYVADMLRSGTAIPKEKLQEAKLRLGLRRP